MHIIIILWVGSTDPSATYTSVFMTATSVGWQKCWLSVPGSNRLPSISNGTPLSAANFTTYTQLSTTLVQCCFSFKYISNFSFWCCCCSWSPSSSMMTVMAKQFSFGLVSPDFRPSVLWHCWLGNRKGIRPVKTEWWGAGVVICLEQGADLHMAQLMPLPLTVSCFRKILIGFTFLFPAHLGSPGKKGH